MTDPDGLAPAPLASTELLPGRRSYYTTFFGLILFAAALWFLHNALRQYSLSDVLRQVEGLPRGAVWVALGLTGITFVVLTGYDRLGLRFVGRSLPYRKVAFASMTSFAISQGVGFPMLTAVPLRFRIYTAFGLTAVETSGLIFFYVLTFWLGIVTLGGVTLLAEPTALATVLPLPATVVRLLGALALAAVGGYVAWSVAGRGRLRLRGWEFQPPSPGLTLLQVFLGVADWTVSGAVLYVLLPPETGLSLPAFLGIFLIAQVAGVLSTVPGGLGVLEAGLLLMLPDSVPRAAYLGSLVAYRGIFYLLPLLGGSLALGAFELRRYRVPFARVGQWTSNLAPALLALATFSAGTVLLFSGALPAVPGRIASLSRLLPLPVIELSHFVGSLVGAGLLILARGIRRRIDAAYHLAVGLLILGIAASLLKGIDFEEATFLAILLFILLPAHRQFYRRASLLADRFTPSWLTAVGVVVIASIWLGWFSVEHVGFDGSLWWRFALDADAPRFLRASVGVVVLLLAAAAGQLLRPAPPSPSPPTGRELVRVEKIVQESPQASAALAFLGDKRFLFSASGLAFIMYGVQGRTWVSMGDPVGPVDEWTDLIWRFREEADRHDDRAVFHEVSRSNLDLYLEHGFTLLKVGEEARVDLARFTMEGGHRKSLRHTLRNLERLGCTFEIVPAGETDLGELRIISDAWLAEKSTREKGFSLGFFDERYLARFPLGLVRQNGRTIAFTNLWLSGEKCEVAPDLMRHVPGSPNGVMDYLFVQLMLWSQAEGYTWFNLGMAPLAGLENRRLAPIWSRLGALVFRLGDHLYSFEGLRQYKEKFDPVWEPKFLAAPGGLALPRILTNISTLIAGGLDGVFTR